mgnify:CR=1 FL=1
MKKTIITVIGKDTVGIIAKVCTFLAENQVNILDISQTIVQDYFNMMMIVDANNAEKKFGQLSDEMAELGETIGVQIKMQSEDIFNAFHLTPLSEVKVLLLGQDPYHNVNQAHGLSFSVKPGQDIPPSLQNIYKELNDDLGKYYMENEKKSRSTAWWMATKELIEKSLK